MGIRFRDERQSFAAPLGAGFYSPISPLQPKEKNLKHDAEKHVLENVLASLKRTLLFRLSIDAQRGFCFGQVMQQTNIVKALRDVEKDFAARQAALERDLKKKTQDVLEKMMTEFSRKLNEATIQLKLIPKRYRANIGQQAVVRRFLKQLSVTEDSSASDAPKARKTRTKRASKYSEEQILAFLATERTTEDIKKHFNWSAPTFSKYLNPLVEFKKVAVRKEGTSKYWKKP